MESPPHHTTTDPKMWGFSNPFLSPARPELRFWALAALWSAGSPVRPRRLKADRRRTRRGEICRGVQPEWPGKCKVFMFCVICHRAVRKTKFLQMEKGVPIKQIGGSKSKSLKQTPSHKIPWYKKGMASFIYIYIIIIIITIIMIIIIIIIIERVRERERERLFSHLFVINLDVGWLGAAKLVKERNITVYFWSQCSELGLTTRGATATVIVITCIVGCYSYQKYYSDYQWPFQEPMHCTWPIFQAYVTEYPRKIWPYMVQ